MNLSLVSVGLLLAAIGIFAFTARDARPTRARLALLATAVAIAAVGHLGIVRVDPEGALRLRAPQPHLHEFFHYYLGAKYFDVLGYTGLYDAAVLADLEDEPERFQPAAPMRDLASNAPMLRGAALDRAHAVKTRFAPARWDDFKRDVAVIRDAMPSELWHRRGFVQDHGYNATPLVTALLGSLASQSLLSTHAFIDAIRWVDLELLILTGAAVGGILGPAVGLGFLVVTFANPLDDYAFIGGAYLRYGHLIALVGAIVALRRRWRALAGVCFAVACGLRVFPIVLYGAFVLHALLQPDRGTRLRAQLRVHGAFALTSLAILAATGSLATPSGQSAWRDFARNLSLHATTPSANLVGLRTPFAYAPGKDRHPDAETRAVERNDFDWAVETKRLLDRRWHYRLAAGILLAIAGIAALRRSSETEFVLPGLMFLFALQPLSHYDWAILALVPIAAPERRGVLLGLAGTLGVLTLLAAPGPLETRLDLRFTLVSLALGAFLLAACSRTARSGVGLAVAVSLAAIGCAEPTAPPTIAGDTYHSRALGFTVDKPKDWHFGPVSSLERDEMERVRDLARLWELLEMKVVTPLVSASPTADAVEGRDPVFRVYVIPARPSDTPSGLSMQASIPLTHAVTGYAHSRVRKPGFAIDKEARETKLGNRDGAVIDLRYQIAREDGDLLPVREQVMLIRRDVEFWYFSLLVPEPSEAETEAQLAGMLASVRLDD